MAYRLGVDLGTTNTVASVAADGAPAQLLGLGASAQQMRTMVFLTEDDQFVVGDAAVERGASEPSRLITDPRRQLGTDVPLIVGGQQFTPEQATAELINFVVSRATAQQHEPPGETILSHPAHWDEYKIECFDRAIDAANLSTVRRCTDAEAALATYAARQSLGNGQRVAVYDLGGGSCEVSVLEKTPDGARVLGASEGAEHPSGSDFDEAVLRLVISNLGDRGRDLDQDDPDSQRRLAELRRACTQAKEALSTAPEAQVPVSLPGYQTTIRLGRQEFVSLVRPALRESVEMTGRVLRGAGVQGSDLAAIILVGGCCRMPVVAELLQREFGGRIALGTHPEYDVAIGTLLLSDAGAAVAAALATEEVPASPPLPAAGATADPVEEDATVITEAPRVQAPAVASEDDRPTDQIPAVAATIPATAAADAPVPGPQAPAPTPEETMPDHLIFDYFTSTDAEADETIPGQPAYAAPAPPLPSWAQESATIPSAGSPAVGSTPPAETPQYGAQMASSTYPQGQRPPGSPPPRPGSAPSPGQYPPGQYPGPRGPGSPGPWSPGYSPGTPPTQPYGAQGPGSPGGYPPGPGGEGSGPFGSRGKLILIIAGVVLLVGAAVVAGVLIFRSGEPGTSTASPSVVFPPASPIPGSPTPSASQSTAPSGSPSAVPSGTPSAGTGQNLPKSAAIPESVVVVAFREAGESERPIYLIDSESKINRVKLPAQDGRNANPLLPASRDTIIYLNSGVLRVMAADGSGDRKLFNQDPAGCDHVDFASWSLADPNVIVISCRISTNKRALMVIGMNGKLIRRLDAGTSVIGDLSLSPDGQTVAYFSGEAGLGGGSLYTLPIIGTGAPKQLTDSGSEIDSNPAWSPDGTQIAFSRRNSWDNNYDVFVMNADGSGQRPIAETPSVDFKPTWSPDGTTMLIVSNRKSAFGGPRKTQDLWVTRVRDGEVLGSLGLEAREIARPFWALR
jgi:Hsp70 protein/WD40-like Beta Propeller Repeat